MKLTTLNLYGFHDWEARKPAIVRYLREEDPDVIFFQEAVYIPEISPYNQAQLLNQELSYPYEQSVVTRLQPSPDYATFREGLAVLSKYAIAKSDTVVLKQSPGDEHNRILQCVDIVMGNEVLKLANAHLSITDVVDYATPQLQEALEYFESHGERRIMAGDFNLSDMRASAELWQNDYASTSVLPYVSYPSKNKATDYALVPKEFTIKTIALSSDDLSDHRGLTVTIDKH